MRCKKCKTELFDCDVVDTETKIIKEGKVVSRGHFSHYERPKIELVSTSYRCPKCYKTKVVKE